MPGVGKEAPSRVECGKRLDKMTSLVFLKALRR